jgi:hypothetical protein
LSGWCDTIYKIRDWVGYILYISTAFALFNILTERKGS